MPVSETMTEHAGQNGAVPRVTAARLKEWVRTAQPNARLTYAQGASASQSCSKELRETVWGLAEKGYLTPHTVTLGPGHKVQIVQRTQRPMLKGVVL